MHLFPREDSGSAANFLGKSELMDISYNLQPIDIPTELLKSILRIQGDMVR